jgi:hypothetical protein
MDVRMLKELGQRLDDVAALLDIMGGDPITVDLYREASNALSQALAEIERLRSDADRHRETSKALQDALAEVERVRSDAADLHRTKFDGGPTNLPPASIATDRFMNFLERKLALVGDKVMGRKSDAE